MASQEDKVNERIREGKSHSSNAVCMGKGRQQEWYCMGWG